MTFPSKVSGEHAQPNRIVRFGVGKFQGVWFVRIDYWYGWTRWTF